MLRSSSALITCPPRRRAKDRSLTPLRPFRRQHFALADVVGLAHHAFLFHALDDAGGAVVADLQVALDEAGGAFALARHQRHRLVVEVVARAAIAAAEAAGIVASQAVLVALGHPLQVDRKSTRLNSSH